MLTLVGLKHSVTKQVPAATVDVKSDYWELLNAIFLSVICDRS